MAKSRVKKVDDGPKITMMMTKGHLVPMSAFDQEMLASWREGAIVNVSPVLAQVRPLEKRYFSMLSMLLKQAETGWTNVLAAHKTIKLATGFVEPRRTESGDWVDDERHIGSFTDAELQEYFELFCGIVQTRFGIDPATLIRESADVGHTHTDPADTASTVSDGSLDENPTPVTVEAPNSADTHAPAQSVDAPGESEEEPGDGGGVTQGATTTDSSDVSMSLIASDEAAAPDPGERPGAAVPRTVKRKAGLRDDELDWLKNVGKMLIAATEPGGGNKEAGVIHKQVEVCKLLAPKHLTPSAKKIAQQIYEHCLKVCFDNIEMNRKWVATIAGCTIDDLWSPPPKVL